MDLSRFDDPEFVKSLKDTFAKLMDEKEKRFNHAVQRMHRLIDKHGLNKILEKIKSNVHRSFQYQYSGAHLMWELFDYVSIFGVEKSLNEIDWEFKKLNKKFDDVFYWPGEIYFYDGLYFCQFQGQGVMYIVFDKNFDRVLTC